jgi:hypothetical protein
MTQSCFFPRSKRNFKITWHFVKKNFIYTLFLRFLLFFLGLINSVILSTFLKLRTERNLQCYWSIWDSCSSDWITLEILLFYFSLLLKKNSVTQILFLSRIIWQLQTFNQVFISFLNTFWARINSFSSNLNPFRKLRDNSHFRRKIPLQ